jgi:hypothetical protein
MAWFRDALVTGEAQARRINAGVSMRSLARMVGAPERGTLRRWESGKRTPQDHPLAARVALFYLTFPEVDA